MADLHQHAVAGAGGWMPTGRAVIGLVHKVTDDNVAAVIARTVEPPGPRHVTGSLTMQGANNVGRYAINCPREHWFPQAGHVGGPQFSSLPNSPVSA